MVWCDEQSMVRMVWILGLVTVMALTIQGQDQGQENSTDYRDYDYYSDPSPSPSDPLDPPEIPKTTPTTTFTFPPTTTPFVVQPPTVGDITPIVEQVDQSCCAIPSLDCSLVNSQQRNMAGASRDATRRTYFADALDQPMAVANQPVNGTVLAQMADDILLQGPGASNRFRRQVELQEQYIDQLGINLLRFESCLCQANRSPSACRMLFPPGFYTPNRPGLFDVIFNGELVVKRFRCSFYNGNIVDCLFQSLNTYEPLSAPMVYFVINDKAELSGRQCITCNSFYCTFEAFKKRNLGSNVPFNQDYAQCVSNRSGTPLPKTTPTPTTPRPFGSNSPGQTQDSRKEAALALRDLSLITRKGILLGLGRPGGQTGLDELYNIKPALDSGHHPILDHPHDHHEAGHSDDHSAWIIILAVIVALLIGVLLAFLLVYFMRRRRSKVGVQRSLRGLPIVKLDVLDPSPFCGGGAGGSAGSMDNDYDYRSGVSEVSRGAGSGSLYAMTPGSVDSLKYSSGGDAVLPVARVVPFPKPARKPLKQPLPPAPPPSRPAGRSSVQSSIHTDHSDLTNNSRFRGGYTPSTFTTHHHNNRDTRRNTTATALQENPRDDNSVFLPRRPEIRERNNNTRANIAGSVRSDASSVHIYTTTKKPSYRPKVPPRSPGNTLNNRSEKTTNPLAPGILSHFNQGATMGTLKPQVAPRTPRNILRGHENASRSSSTASNCSGRSLIQHNREGYSQHGNKSGNNNNNNNTNSNNNNNIMLSDFSPSPIMHRSISKQRSNLPSTSSSRGSRGNQQGFYYDVDEDFDDYNDIYASIDEEEADDENGDGDDGVDSKMHRNHHHDDDDDDDEVIEAIRGKGHSRYETRICPSQETILPDITGIEPASPHRSDQGSQYEVPVRSLALLDKPLPRIPVKPSRMTHLLPPPSTALANSLPSTIAPPVPQRARPGSSSSSSSSSSSWSATSDTQHRHRSDRHQDPRYADHSSRQENEYTVIRDDLVQTGMK